MKIIAIIVSFNPNITTLSNLLNSVHQQVDEIALIDNNSTNNGEISSLLTTFKKVYYAPLDNNYGIAKAQNIGIKYAFEKNSERIVFFDQDSVVPSNFIQKLTIALSECPSGENVCGIGPLFSDNVRGFIYPLIKLNKCGSRKRIIPTAGDSSPIEVSILNSSGSLINLNHFARTGPLKDDFFIDYVDTVWCLRAQSMGLKFYAAPTVRMGHSIGDRSIKFFGRHIPVHSATRRYYRVRNSILMIKLSYIPKVLALREFFVVTIQQLIFIAIERNKKSYTSSLWRGIIDGAKKIPDKTNSSEPTRLIYFSKIIQKLAVFIKTRIDS